MAAAGTDPPADKPTVPATGDRYVCVLDVSTLQHSLNAFLEEASARTFRANYGLSSPRSPRLGSITRIGSSPLRRRRRARLSSADGEHTNLMATDIHGDFMTPPRMTSLKAMAQTLRRTGFKFNGKPGASLTRDLFRSFWINGQKVSDLVEHAHHAAGNSEELEEEKAYSYVKQVCQPLLMRAADSYYPHDMWEVFESVYSQDYANVFFFMVTEALKQIQNFPALKEVTGELLIPTLRNPGDKSQKLECFVTKDNQIGIKATFDFEKVYHVIDSKGQYGGNYQRQLLAQLKVYFRVRTGHIQLTEIQISSPAGRQAHADFVKALLMGNTSFQAIKRYLEKGVLARCDQNGNPIIFSETMLTELCLIKEALEALAPRIARSVEIPVPRPPATPPTNPLLNKKDQTIIPARRAILLFALLIELISIVLTAGLTDIYIKLWAMLTKGRHQGLTPLARIVGFGLPSIFLLTVLLGLIGRHQGWFDQSNHANKAPLLPESPNSVTLTPSDTRRSGLADDYGSMGSTPAERRDTATSALGSPPPVARRLWQTARTASGSLGNPSGDETYTPPTHTGQEP